MLEEKVLKTIQKYHLIKPKEKIVIGVSGGPDSICLLHILENCKEKLEIELIVAHINHGIRKEADVDEEYVKNYCQQHKIPFFVKKIKVLETAKMEKIGTEEAGRKIRIQFFQEIREQTNAHKIATAHTKNDQAETVLMNLLRGSGLTGLKGINPIREGVYIKPLIECARSEIEAYCEKNQLNPRIDLTNFENTYTRNKIRNQLIPYIQEEYNPNVIDTLARTAEILRQENEYLEEITKKIYEEIMIEQNQEQIILDLKKFNQLELVIKNRIVLYTINMLFGSSSGIEKIHIQDIIKLCQRNIGNKYLIPNQKVKILVAKQKIFFRINKEYP